ncbi:hypothetical protein HR12_21000 [Microbacterium sp. SUBG005]|nr:hypothetical protein HR12_21000 [Microbacterium sp. SUBG005]
MDREAAMREQFPPIEKVRDERPGCAVDRMKQALMHVQNQAAKSRITRSRIEQELDADRFIAEARRRHMERMAVWAQGVRQQHINGETRTA